VVGLMDWSHRLEEVRRRGLQHERTFDEDERRALAEWLDVAGCDQFAVAYTITHVGERRFHVVGELTARLVLTCSVSLEPVVQSIDEPIDVEFWPADEIGDRGISFDALEADDPEPVVNNRLNVGRLAGEILASAIDLFPRACAVELEVAEAGADTAKQSGKGIGSGGHAGTDDQPVSPFAALEKLKVRDRDPDAEGG